MVKGRKFFNLQTTDSQSLFGGNYEKFNIDLNKLRFAEYL
jgi:hypothetical protein